ncbi:MBL fold metallo-hydrolase [Dermacoccus abyssi]|uniref:MBL fold metallo-hydrolase n=1 Tax=Dermacoccus abyssi TaxID=322596 RepID=UPI002AD2337A|nr:MBL fold metallo-hydrolase [Dermacoccus abyssi]
MKLTVVGCSGSFPGPDSPASCYLVEAESEGRTWSVLLDFGNGSLGALQNYREVDDIDAVVISHLHPDHCLDLCSYFVVRNYDPHGRFDSRLPVFAPPGAEERITRAYMVDKYEDLSGAYKFVDLADRATFWVGPLNITPFLVNHPVEAYGLRVEADGAVLAYTGDTDACDALVDLERDADLVLTDSAFVDGRDDDLKDVHLTGSRAAKAAQDAGAKRLVLTHIPAWTPVEDCVRDAKTVWAGEVEVARAGQRYELRA